MGILYLPAKPAYIRQKALYLVLVCLAFFRQPAAGQVSFFYNDGPWKGTGAVVLAFSDSSHDRTIRRFEEIRDQLKPLDNDQLNLSYKDQMLWLLVPIRFFSPQPAPDFLMVRNPHINYVQAWIFRGDSLLHTFPLSGDHQPFDSRVTRFPDYIFPLPGRDRKNLQVLLLLDKRNEQINIPIDALSQQGLSEYNRIKNLLTGLITGLSLFLFLFSLFLYYNMRERLYVYYGLYILCAFLYIFSDYGYLFMYFFPHFPWLADFTRPLAISLATPLYMSFMLRLLELKKRLPVHARWCRRYLLAYFLIFFLSLFFLPEKGTVRLLLVLMMQFFQFLTSLLIFLVAWAARRRKTPYAGYIIASSLTLMISFFFFMLFVSGYIPDTLFTRNLMNIGFCAELSILAFVLTLRFKHYKVQLEKTLREVNIQQEQIFRSISDYQEKEMQRFSSLLHDSVGARLSSLRLHLESAESLLQEGDASQRIHSAVTDISQLADEVRTASHSLSPLLLQEKGLVGSLTQIIDRINQAGELHIQFENIGSLQRVPYRYELMTYNMLQELIQNILKHARADEAIIQLILEKEIISFFVEDNGRGYDQNFHKDGLGFFQIRQLIKFVQGSFQVASAPGQGCRISVEFPVLPDENEHAYFNR